MMATFLIAGAVLSIVADAGIGPLVVQGPHDTLAAPDNLFQVTEGEKALVNPMQVDDVGPLKLVGLGNVRTGIGQTHRPQVLHAETVVHPQHGTLPYEVPFLAETMGQGHHGEAVGLLVANEHPGLDAMVIEGFEQAAGRNGSTTRLLGGIYDENIHFSQI